MSTITHDFNGKTIYPYDRDFEQQNAFPVREVERAEEFNRDILASLEA